MFKGRIRRIDFITLLFVSPFLFLLAASAHAAMLRTEVTVTAPVVTLGDVLDDAGEAAAIQVAASPAPGDRMMLSVDAVARAANGHNLQIQNPYTLTAIAISRAGKEISSATIAKSIADAIRADGDPGEKSVKLSSAQGSLYVPVDAAEEVTVKSLSYNQANGAFTATIELPPENGRIASATVTGRATEVITIPVLSRTVSRGEIIRKNDIDWLQVSPSQVQGSVLADAQDLIGKSARRPLRAGMAVRTGDVQEPVLVGKNTLVTLVASTSSLTLTTIGRSLDDGAEGDVIRVMNTQSHKVVQGTVLSANEVRVEISSRLAALTR